MGYEVRIYVVRPYDFDGLKKGFHASEIISMIDLGKFGYCDNSKAFLNLFNKEIDFTLYMEDYDSDTDREVMSDIYEDKYGQHMCYLPHEKYSGAILFLQRMLRQKYTDVPRIKILIETLKQYKDRDGIYFVHYGH